jgi:transposase InsO family protein
MRRIDELHLELPFAGARMLRDLLVLEGCRIGRKAVSTFMRIMGIEAIFRRKNTSTPHPDHKIFRYLLRKLVIDRANQVWAADISYIPMARGFVYLVAIIDWFSRKVLAWRLSNSMAADFCVCVVKSASIPRRSRSAKVLPTRSMGEGRWDRGACSQGDVRRSGRGGARIGKASVHQVRPRSRTAGGMGWIRGTSASGRAS